MTRTIAVMTGGGDCPGLNAAIRAITRIATHDYGYRVIGIHDGYEGLVEGRLRELTFADTRGILRVGGTILGSSNRTDLSHYVAPGESEPRDRRADAFETLREAGVVALIVIGGDGTMRLTYEFADGRLPVIGVPKTIDNDVHGTDYAIGFQTCITTVADAIDKLHTTAESHHRILLLEVMGRHAGWVALHAGVAGGADVVLIPERSYSLDGIVDTIRRREDRGSRFTIGVVAEGVQSPSGEMVYRARDGASHSWRLGGVCDQLAVSLADRTGSEVRSISLGHIQRGGSPVVADRLLATVLGAAAVEAVHQRQNGVMVGVDGERVQYTSLDQVAAGPRVVPQDHALLRAAHMMGMYVGESR